MSTDIYWFSGSGNSLYLAKRIYEKLNDARLLPVSKAVNESIEKPDRLGLVFPVYAWGPPRIVAEFIEKIPPGKIDYTFAAATFGSAAGSTMAITRRLLGKKGIELDSAFTVKMVENYPPMGGAPSSKKQKANLEAAEPVIEDIAKAVADGRRETGGRGNIFFNLMGKVLYPLFIRGLSKRKKSKFSIDDSCSSCGICAKICPADNITIGDGGRPIWGTRCEQCFACFHWCPEKAVQYGKKTRDQVRYHHPEVRLEEMLPE